MGASVLQAKGNAIYSELTVDLSGSIGKLVTFTAGVPAVNTSTTVAAVGIVLDSRKRAVGSPPASYEYENAIGILGGLDGAYRGLISANATPLNFGDTVIQAADGTLTNDTGPGNARVVVGVVAAIGGAVAGDWTEIVFYTPQVRS